MSNTSTIKVSSDETLQLVADWAKQNGDSFILKLHRRAKSGLLENLATFNGATCSHILSAETWISRLFGGGDYAIAVYPAADGKRIGSYVMYNFGGEPIQPNVNIIGGTDWIGPTDIQFLASENRAVRNPFLAAGSMAAVQQQSVPQSYFQPGMTLQQGYGAPPAQPAIPTVSPTVANWVGPAQQAQQAQQFQTTPNNDAAQYLEAIARREREISEREAKIAKIQAEKEMQLRQLDSEQRMRGEFEAKQRELQAVVVALKAEAARPPPETFSIEKALAAAAPLVTALMQMQAESRNQMMKLQAEAEARRDVQQQQLFALITQKPAGPDAATLMLIETLKAQASQQGTGPVAEMMTQMVNAMSTVSRTSIGMVEAIADMNLGGQPENPMLSAVKEGIKAIATLSAGTAGGARRVAQAQQPRQLPPPAQIQPQPMTAAPQPPPPTARPVPVQTQIAQQGQSGHPNVQVRPVAQAPRAQPVPVPVHPFMPVEAALQPAPNMPQAFDGAPTPVAPALLSADQALAAFGDNNSIDVIEGLIRSKYEPVEGVAELFFLATETAEMKEALQANGGEIDSLLQDRLGDWIMASDDKGENLDYLKRLGFVIDRIGTERGILEMEPGDEDLEENSVAF